jgi:hypothetical protein
VAVGGTHARGTLNIVEGTGLSSVTETELPSDEGLEGLVEIVPLDDLLTSHAGSRRIDFLKIDIEGAEAAVINTSRFEARPRIIVVEATAPNSQDGVWGEWEPHLLRQGYGFVWFDGLNRYYLAEEERWRAEFFAVPPNVFDNFKSVPYSHRGREKAVQEDRDSLRIQLNRVEENRGVLRRQLDAIALQLKDVSADLAAVGRERDHLRGQLKDAAGKIRALEESREVLAARLGRKIQTLEDRLEKIVSSKTWRLTRPLRAAVKLLRAGRA